MIFSYHELKEYVQEDFDRFYQMGLNERQILPAVLNEYEHGEDFSRTENLCIHVCLALNYRKSNLNSDEITEKLKRLLADSSHGELLFSQETDASQYAADFEQVWNPD